MKVVRDHGIKAGERAEWWQEGGNDWGDKEDTYLLGFLKTSKHRCPVGHWTREPEDRLWFWRGVFWICGLTSGSCFRYWHILGVDEGVEMKPRSRSWEVRCSGSQPEVPGLNKSTCVPSMNISQTAAVCLVLFWALEIQNWTKPRLSLVLRKVDSYEARWTRNSK